MSGSPDPIRAQLIEARRNQILDAAAQVFAEKGFHRTTTKDIAGAAGVSEGTIYNYFDSKDELLIGLMSRVASLETFGDELLEALQGDVRDFFVAMFHDRSDRVQGAEDWFRVVLPEVMVNEELRQRFYEQFVGRIAALLEQYVQVRIEKGDVRPVDATLVARAVQAMFVGLILMRVLGDEPVLSRWDDVPEVVAGMIFDGLKSREDV